jgi:DNA (cytosine-5)-methyltransferase 1
MSLIYRRIHPLKPSYTVVAHGGGGTSGYHYERDRSKLTNREKARLQTFPDQFVFKGGISQVRAQIGEAVPPFLGKKIAESVKLILGFATR